MTTTTHPGARAHTRVPNWKIDQLLADVVPFTNYNASIYAELREDGIYTVTHWHTEIVRIDTKRRALGKDAVVFINFGYRSQTTSTLQGRIIRHLLTRREVLNLIDWYTNQGDKAMASRIRKLAWLR